MPQLFYATLNWAVIAIYDGATPLCTAVFISATRALTAYHNIPVSVAPVVGAVLTGRSTPSAGRAFPVQTWTFNVVAVSPGDDLVVLEIATGPRAAHFIPPVPPGGTQTIDALLRTGSNVWLATFGVSLATLSAGDLYLGSFCINVPVPACSARHFIYGVDYVNLDSGGAVINAFGQLVGLHLGGWIQAAPPPLPPSVDACTRRRGRRGKRKSATTVAVESAAARMKNVARKEAMGLAYASEETCDSVAALARQLPYGGYAIYLGTPAVAALLTAAAPSAPAGGDGTGGSRGGGRAGKKRTRAERCK